MSEDVVVEGVVMEGVVMGDVVGDAKDVSVVSKSPESPSVAINRKSSPSISAADWIVVSVVVGYTEY